MKLRVYRNDAGEEGEGERDRRVYAAPSESRLRCAMGHLVLPAGWRLGPLTDSSYAFWQAFVEAHRRVFSRPEDRERAMVGFWDAYRQADDEVSR